MSLNSINKFMNHDKVWIGISTFFILLLLSPLLFYGGNFYVTIYDNLDSTVVWYKILAHSGMIFADNNAIIPNMMNGLPRSTYYGEFNMLLWLYYFFDAKIAYVINEVLIHLVAFFSMYIFLKRYVVKEKRYYQNVPIFIGALYFAMLPYWSGAGLTLVTMPIVTYSLLNIKNHIDSKWDWILLLFLPLYTSFIFFYMFYIIFAGFYLLWISLQNRQVHKRLFLALLLMGTVFLLTEYRLVYAMFIDSGFISHRTEFNIFFSENLWECYRLSLVQFLIGHAEHAPSLQGIYLLPIALTALILTFLNRRLTSKESLVIWALLIVSFFVPFWKTLLIHKFTLPSIALLSILSIFIQPKYKKMPILLLFIIFLSLFSMMFEYKGLTFISDLFPIFKALNMTRLNFIQPFLYSTLLVFAIIIFYRKLHYSTYFMLLFICFQFYYNYTESLYQTAPKEGYASFETYYTPALFKNLKKSIPLENNPHFVSYAMEPAIALYNGLYTVDGYSANYPLSYKFKFKKVFSEYLNKDTSFSDWGSKLYIETVPHLLKYYVKGLKLESLRLNNNALCELNTTYILSPYQVANSLLTDRNMTYINTFKGNVDSWDIYLYKIHCHKPSALLK